MTRGNWPRAQTDPIPSLNACIIYLTPLSNRLTQVGQLFYTSSYLVRMTIIQYKTTAVSAIIPFE